mmetsp:Transcript_86614/g.136673  ORF Transcript_86614/g.136673 Transcript_86614/m.136673 type:complete len:460 (+) Transcript_86614:82-1461(+)
MKLLYFFLVTVAPAVRLRLERRDVTLLSEPVLSTWSYGKAGIGCDGKNQLVVTRKGLGTRCVEGREFFKLVNYIKQVFRLRNNGFLLRATEVVDDMVEAFLHGGEDHRGCSVPDFQKMWETVQGDMPVYAWERLSYESVLQIFEERGGREFLTWWHTEKHDEQVIPLLEPGVSCREGCMDPVEPTAQWDVCNPDIPGNNELKWVPLSKLRIPQRGARAMMTAPPGGLRANEALPTIIGNVLDRPDPRGINCLMVCQEQNKNTGRSIYWTEGTRRVIGWFLGGVPQEMVKKDLVPVKMVNCLQSDDEISEGTNFYVNDASFGNGQEGAAILNKLGNYKKILSGNGTVDYSQLAFWSKTTPVLMYSLADPGSNPELLQEHQAYTDLKQYFNNNIDVSLFGFRLSFADDVASDVCKDGQCGSKIVDECKLKQANCAIREIYDKIKAAAIKVVDDWSKSISSY